MRAVLALKAESAAPSEGAYAKELSINGETALISVKVI